MAENHHPTVNKADPRQLHQAISAALMARDLPQAGLLLQQAPAGDINFDFMRGLLCQQQKDFTAAIGWFDTVLAIRPDWIEAAYSRVQAQIGAKQIDDAIVAARTLLSQTTAPIPALLLAEAADIKGDQALANEAREKAIRRGARDPHVISDLWLGRRKIWDWSQSLPDFTTDMLTPAAATVLSEDPAFQKQVAELYGAKYFPTKISGDNKPNRAGRIRLGYLSSDIHHHATAYLIAELFALHDRSRFEVTCFSAGTDDGSEIRQRIAGSAEHFIDIARNPQALIDHPVDILIDLKGHTRGHLLPLLARIKAQPQAPIIIHYLGHPGTIGVNFVDYLVGDNVVTPTGSDVHYTEKLIRLPGCYQINDRVRPVAKPLPRASYNLPDDKIVLACFNQSYKLTPEMFAQWADILHARPNTILWLYSNVAGAEENLRAHMKTLNLTDDRLVIAGPLPNDQHLARYQAADIVIDTYPYTSHTTGSDALWAGVPLVTRMGTTYASRVAASLLTHVGLSELITETESDYRQLILDLIDDAPRREKLRKHLQHVRSTAPLFDTPRWVAGWEAELAKLI